jgi:uncharacterized protein YjbI with pentapeptide repeats
MKKHILSLALLLPALVYGANQQDLDKLMALKKSQATIHLDLSNVDLRHYPFVPGKIDLQGANMSHSNLSGVDLSKMNLAGADLSYSDLSQTRLNESNLAGANLDHANLTGALMEQSNLEGANLNHAILTAAKLKQAILAKANLTCANLNQADLTKSDFAATVIAGATFTNTVVLEIEGYESVIDKEVTCS